MTNEPDSKPESLLETNRAYDRKLDDQADSPISVNLQLIDETIINHLSDTINLTVEHNGRVIPVPVMYANPERWKAVQKDGFLREPKSNKLQAPLVLIRRTTITRDVLTNPSNKYIHTTHTSEWNSRNVYDRFAVQNRITPSQRVRHVMIPDYIRIAYDIVLFTDYEAQMNSLIEQINVENEEYWGLRNQFKFRTRIDQYASDTELPPSDDRMVRSTFTMEVFGYLLPTTAIKNFTQQATNYDSFTKKKVIITSEVDETDR